MDAKWNMQKQKYDITFSEKELGILLFALTVAKYESKDAGVADLQKQLLDLNNAPVE